MTIATNPQTNETVFLNEAGEWTPAKIATNPAGEKLAFDGSTWVPVTQSRQEIPEVLGAVGKLAQGFTFGHGDEITGHERAILGRNPQGDYFDYSKPYKERYTTARDLERNRQEDYQKQSPGISTGAEIFGAVVSPAAKIGQAAKGASMLEKMVRGGGQGLGLGFLYGAGEAKEIGDIPKDAMMPAGVGTMVGALAPPAVKGAGSVISSVARPILDRLPYTQKNAAARQIAKAISDEGLTPGQATAKIESMGPEAMLMDVGENLQGQARAVHSIPGPGRTMIAEKLAQRQEGTAGPQGLQQGSQFDRVENTISGLGGDFHAGKQSVVDERKALGVVYEAAKQADELVDVAPILKELDDEILVSKGGIKAALEKIRSYMVDPSGRPEIDFSSLHQAKVAIDELMGGEARTSMSSIAKGKIRDYQNRLVEAIENSGEAGGLYKAGRLGTAGQWKIDEALELGRDFLLKSKFKDNKQLAAYVNKLTPEELEGFKSGIIQKLKEQIGDTAYTANASKSIIGKPALERKLLSVFGEDDFKLVKKFMQDEQQMYSTYGKVRGGSPTSLIAAEQSSLMQDPGRLAQGVRGILSGSPTRMISGVVDVGGAIKNRVALPEKVSKEMAQALSSRGNVKGLEKEMIKLQNQDAVRNRIVQALTPTSIYGAN